MTEAMEANRDQAAHWNAAAGETWVELQDVLDRLLAPVGDAVVEAGFPGAGGRVLDIGCGAGATTLGMARKLGPAGRALGVDISRPLVQAAAKRAAAEVANADFMAEDAQTHRFEGGAFDAVISRFGVMFFEDPAAAFANIRAAARPGGKLAFAAWRSPAENPFMTAAARAAAGLVEIPRPAPDAPGQFAFADDERVRAILEGAGWRGVELAPLDVEGALPAADLQTYVLRMGPVGQALQGMDEAERTPVVEAVRRAFQPFVQGDTARFNMACWLATARA